VGEDPDTRMPLVVVLSGPGGAGKGTIARALVEGDDRLALSRSWTSRERRVDDVADAYVCVDRATFEARRDEGGFLEWNEFLGRLYGTPTPDIDDPRDLLLEIDVAGGRQVLERLPDALCLFVDAPDDEELVGRLVGRGESVEQAEARVREATRERDEAEQLGYLRVVNDNLDEAVVRIASLIGEHRRSNG